MLMPFCGNSIIFQWQAVSRTLKTSCRRLLELGGRLPLLEATVARLNDKATALVNAVAARGLTSAEAASYGVAQPQFRNAKEEAGYASGLLDAEREEQEFYAILQKRCTLIRLYMGSATSNRYLHNVLRWGVTNARSSRLS
jgi:hypothetical protein